MSSTRIRLIPLALMASALAAETASFQAAKPVWVRGRETEMNLPAGFRAIFERPGAAVRVRIAASSLYRLFVNGEFRAHGPARGPHGYYRVDEWNISPLLKPGRNVVAIEVAGYNVNSYYVLNQPSFLQAEVLTDSTVLAATGGQGFQARVLSERVQKVERYSFQRAFSEVYRMAPGFDRWRGDPAAAFEAVPLAVTAPKQLIARGVPYPNFEMRQPVARVSEGELNTAVPVKRITKGRWLTGIGPDYLGYPEAQLEAAPSFELQKVANARVTTVAKPYSWREPLPLGAASFQLFDFGTNLTGFIGARVTAKKKTRLFLTFDEMLSGTDVNFRRLGTVNIVAYELAPGTYDLESFEPYTLRYLKAMVLEGDCAIERVHLREYKNPSVWSAHFASSDEGLNRLFAAGRETYSQNATDVFMDCPSRERAGWLCDSYFTARVEHVLSGGSEVEKAFLQNYLLPKSFEHLPEGMVPMCYPADHYNGRFIPNWSLWFVLELEEYAARSGDRALVDAMRPRVAGIFDYFKKFRNEDGLLENLESWVFIEWSDANKFVQNVNYPSNMLYAAALDAAGRIYGAPEWRAEAERVRDTIRRQSFDGEFFVDNAIRQNGKLVRTRNRTETCQYYAFYLGTAAPDTHAELWRKLRDEFGPDRAQKKLYPEIRPSNAFIGNVLRLELLSRYGLVRQLIAEARSYLLYMADRTGTLWENITPSASLDHGFASHVVNVLYRDVLGLYRMDWVNKSVRVRFTDSPLEWCEGRIPTPDGAVWLRWSKQDGAIVYKLDVPAGYTAEVENLGALPVSKQ